MAHLRFRYGDTLPLTTEAVEGELFFNSSTKRISRYTGAAWEDYGGDVVFITGNDDFPSSGQRQGVLYIKVATGVAKVWTGSAWVVVSDGHLTIDSAVATKDNDNSVPSTKAVYTAISDLETTMNGKFGTSNGQAPTVGSDGKLPTSVIPALAISEYVGTFTDWTAAAASSAVASAQKGDYLIIKVTSGAPTADDGTWILSGDTPTSKASWTQISTPDTDTTYDLATTTSPGLVQPDGTTITVNNGVITAVSDDTWRAITVKGNDFLSTANTSGAVNFAEGSNVTLTASSGTITIAAQDTTYTGTGGVDVNSSTHVISLTKAASDTLGGVKINGNNLSIDSNGVLSATDTWRAVSVDGTQKLASNVNTGINFVGGSNVTLTYSDGSLTIAAVDTTYSVATQSSNGLLSAEDKTIIDNGLTWEHYTPSQS